MSVTCHKLRDDLLNDTIQEYYIVVVLFCSIFPGYRISVNSL